MSDENDTIFDGGEAGGAVPKILLKRSELAVLRRLANRYPIGEQDRIDTVDCVVDIVRKAKSNRLKIAAVKALTGLDRLNLAEVQTYLMAKKTAGDELQPAPGSTIVNVAIQNNVTVESVLDEYSRSISPRAVQAQSAQDNGTGKQVHPRESGKAEGNGKAS